MPTVSRIRVEVFRAGTWTDSSGATRHWSVEDIEEIARRYNSQDEHEAPVVVGHPRTDSPAYGWVKRLERVGRSLWAEIEPTVGEFVDWVRRGLYRKVSVALYGDNLLRHVGFLGGTPPAVKGLSPVELAGGEGDYAEWEMADAPQGEMDAGSEGGYDPADTVRELRRARTYGGHRLLSRRLEEELQGLRERMSEYREALSEREREIEALEQRVSEYRRRLGEIEIKERRREFARYLRESVEPGALTQEQQGFILALYDHLLGSQFSEGGEGGEGDSQGSKFDPVEGLMEFVASLKAPVPIREIATEDRAAPPGAELERKVREYRERRPGVGEYEALKAALKENPELRGI